MWVVPALVLVWHALRFGFVTDDAYISFVYARNLAEHGELSFNLGDPVEGYSNFLWTVTLAGAMALGASPEMTSLVLGIGFAIGTLAVVARLARELYDERPSGWDALAPAFLALSAGYACWSTGGLETQMFTFWISAGLYAYVRADSEPRWMRWVGVLFGLAALTRPEGLLVLAVVGVHRYMVSAARDRRWLPRKQDWLGAGLALALVVPHLAWRWWYYGYPLPNTYYVKASGQTPPGYSAALWKSGWYYLWRWSWQSGALFATPLAVVGALVASRASRRWFFGTCALAVAAAYVVYTASVGGDFMGLYRFVMPLFVLVAVLAAAGLRSAAQWSSGRALRMTGAALAVAVVLVYSALQVRLGTRAMATGNWASDRGIDSPAFLEVYTEDRARIGRHMRPCFEPDDFSIVGGAGAQPYYGHMRAIDVFGLVSREVAHQVPPTHPRAGHNKWAPDAMLAELEPEFVFSCYSIHRDPEHPRLNCNPSFWHQHGYEQVTLHIPGLEQQGEYYTFFKRKDRTLRCEGIVETR